MGRLLAEDFRHFDLLNAGLAGGKADVVAAYHRFVSSLPLDVSFVVDDVSAGSTGKICVSWCAVACSPECLEIRLYMG